MAKRSVALNGLTDRIEIICDDINHAKELFSQDSFHAVVSNPPYFPVQSGVITRDGAQAIARTERCCSFDELCLAASRLLSCGGSFFLVHKPERLAELLSTLRAHRLEPKRLRLVRNTAGAAVSLVLIEARLGAGTGLRIENDLILSNPDGTPTAEYRRIYHLI